MKNVKKEAVVVSMAIHRDLAGVLGARCWGLVPCLCYIHRDRALEASYAFWEAPAFDQIQLAM